MRAQDDTKHGDVTLENNPICFALIRAYPLINLLLGNPMQWRMPRQNVTDEIELSFNPLVYTVLTENAFDASDCP